MNEEMRFDGFKYLHLFGICLKGEEKQELTRVVAKN